MSRLRTYITLAALGVSLTGCVSAEDFAKVKLQRDQLAEQLGHSQTEINEANARANAAQQQLVAQGNLNASKSAANDNAARQIADLEAQNADWSKKYRDAMDLVGQAGTQALPTTLNNQLTAFAQQNPDLVDFDSGRGVVKFKSDVTFAVGDATVTPKAKEVLSRFASILNQNGANGYELLVAGHTDSTPVTNDRTKRLGHFNNWYLSSHRAISVGSELIADGVSAKRMGMVGYADERPAASNATEAGKLANRRVEVLILPTSVRATSSTVAAAEPAAPRAPRRSTGRTAPTPAVPAAAHMDKDSLSSMNK